MEEKNVLQQIQAELKAPKGQYNSFGKYKYRSCEDILEAVKPLLNKYDAVLMLSDELRLLGDRYYVMARATITKGGEVLGETTAFAREPEEKKGMDTSQITGTASSYARKYALNGLFLIDDTKDADTDEYQTQTSGKTPNSKKNNLPEGDVKAEADLTKPTDKIDEMSLNALKKQIAAYEKKTNKKLDEEALCNMFSIKKIEDMNYEQLRKLTASLNK